MSCSDGSVDYAQEEQASRGNGETEGSASTGEVEVVNKPLGDRRAASRAAGFKNSTQLACTLYKNYGWLRNAEKELAQCPTCDGIVPCKNSNTSNMWRHWHKCNKEAYAAKTAIERASAGSPRQQMLSFECVPYDHLSSWIFNRRS